MFHSFFNSLARSRYLSYVSHSFSFILWSARTAKSAILQILSFFFFFCWLLIGLVWFVCMSKSQKSLCVLFWHINLCMLFNAKATLLEEQYWYYLTHSWEDKGVDTFPKGICPKVNVIAQLEYELAYYDFAVHLFNHYTRRCPWCNCYRRRKWTRRLEFKSWTRLIAFHIALIPLGNVWIQLFSLQLWVNRRTDWFLQPWWGEGKLWIQTCQTPLKNWPCVLSCLSGGVGK